jgi:hypothetical protein
MERRCTQCRRVATEVEFPARGARCLECRRAGIRDHYRRNRSYYLAKARKRQLKVIAETRSWLVGYLLEHPCSDCGETDPLVLEFDHRSPATKNMEVAVLARSGYPLRRVQAEVALCDVRCANCHRRRTHAQQGWWGAPPAAT